jgi:predicted ribosome quality control (RQC) complex YloA/Tae2 family protein
LYEAGVLSTLTKVKGGEKRRERRGEAKRREERRKEKKRRERSRESVSIPAFLILIISSSKTNTSVSPKMTTSISLLSLSNNYE